MTMLKLELLRSIIVGLLMGIGIARELNVSEQQMREALKKAYPSPAWRTKVDKMSGHQVYAVYNCMKNEGRL